VQAVDRGIARIVEAAEEAGILDRTTFVVTGDHGFSDIHTQLAPNVWLVGAGFMEDRSDRGNWRATIHTSGASAFLMLRNPNDRAAVERVRRILADLPPGTRRLFQVIDTDRMRESGADPASPLSISGIDGVSMTAARSGEAVRPGRGGTHGHFPDFARMGTGFIAWGAGIREGARIPHMGLVDVAPIVARLLGLEFRAPGGTLLPGVFREAP
jgi:arylsulfatase A-like enzyme